MEYSKETFSTPALRAVVVIENNNIGLAVLFQEDLK